VENEKSVSNGLIYINEQFQKMISGEIETYEAGRNIWVKALSLANDSENTMWAFWLMWGALTDWAEEEGEGILEAEEAMLRAAKEWLELENNEEQREAYFQRWLYDELGYKREN
jgi:hypothetical protein